MPPSKKRSPRKMTASAKRRADKPSRRTRARAKSTAKGSRRTTTARATTRAAARGATGSAPPHFLVIVPGFMGSKLRDRTTGEIVWVDFSKFPLNPLQWESWLAHLFATMRYPNDNLEPAGIIDDVIFAPPWIKQEQYSRLLRGLENMGYRADATRYSGEELDVYTFAYDWRQDNRISGRQLGEAIERWSAFHPDAEVWLMGHSNGGIVARWYIEKEGGKDRVGRLILLASPWDGAVKSMHILFNGLDMLFRLRFNLFQMPQRTRETLRTFPAAYQLIPHEQPFLRGPNNETVDPFLGENWLEDSQQRALLADARRFNEELGTNLSVETLAFFGRKLPTTTAGDIHYGAGRRWSNIQWVNTDEGDGTLPEHTAVFANARQNIPIIAGHGDIYVNEALYEILRWELVDKYRGGRRAAVTTERLTVIFNPERDVYKPGDRIDLWATVHRNVDRAPVTGASISVQLVWRESLPGSERVKPPKNVSETELVEMQETPGRYEGSLAAPAVEGYYALEATVIVPFEKPITLQELIAVESIPTE